MIIYNLKQLSPEWFKIRELKMTGSHAQTIASQGKGLETYIKQLVLEWVEPESKNTFMSNPMAMGMELETKARVVYSLHTKQTVKLVGFVEIDDFVGCSPDGLVEEKGILEIKCPADNTFEEFLKTKKIPTKYIWQCQMNMMLCEKEWCDLVFYNPNFNEKMVIKRILPNISQQEEIKKGLEMGKKLLKTYLEKLTQ